MCGKNIILLFKLVSLKRSLLFTFPTKITLIISRTRVPCPTDVTLLDLITQTVLCAEYKLCCYIIFSLLVVLLFPFPQSLRTETAHYTRVSVQLIHLRSGLYRLIYLHTNAKQLGRLRCAHVICQVSHPQWHRLMHTQYLYICF
jgi:hypothetical protein